MTTKTYDVLAITNDKGGVGKTTSVVNMALALTDEPWSEKVLVIDLDAQMNACMNLGWNPAWEKDMRPTLFSSLCGQVDNLTAYYSAYENCFYIPSSKRMVNVDPFLQQHGPEMLYVLRELMKQPVTLVDPDDNFKVLGTCRIDQYFDKVFLDCPPSMGVVTMNAWAAARSLIVAFQMEEYCVQGLRAIINNYVTMVSKKQNPELKLRGILRTMYESRLTNTREINDDLMREMKKFVLDTIIPRSTKVPQAQKKNKAVVFDAPEHPVSRAYYNLIHELYDKED